MIAAYEQIAFGLEAAARTIAVRFRLINRSHGDWRTAAGFAIGWQIYDPETGTFIREGDWTQLSQDVMSAEMADIQLSVQLPPERGRYHVYISPRTNEAGWFYAVNEPFLLIDVF